MKNIRTSKLSKIVASYLAIQLIVTTIQPTQMFALTGGPSQPEFNSFTPIGTSDMVNLSSGDFNYNIPIMDVGGYPLNLAYDSGITMDQEASWVGLGWNLNVGQIARQVRGLPDDFKGDEVRYENDMRDNVTIGTNFNIQPGFFGDESPLDIGLGLGVQYNNYEGITFKPSFGPTYTLSDNVAVGVNFSSSSTGGVSVSPSVSLSTKSSGLFNTTNTIGANLGVSFNSRKGLEEVSLSFSGKRTQKYLTGGLKKLEYKQETTRKGSFGGSISFNDQSYTPFKRAGLSNGNFSFSAGIGLEASGFEIDGRVTGYGSFQKIRNEEKNKLVKAYGYEHTEANEGQNGVLDFNREKDKVFTKNTTVLPVTNYTYDIYAIQGQGIGGQFRPFRSQTSYVYDQEVTDEGLGGSFGVEFGLGGYFHGGADINISPSTSRTGKWEDKNYARPRFVEESNDPNPLEYERVYFSSIGELGLDTEPELFQEKLKAEKPIKIKIEDHRAKPKFVVKSSNLDGSPNYDTIIDISSSIKRTKRFNRNQSIQKITQKEAQFESQVEQRTDNFVKNHHTAGIKILKPDGSTYVYGKAAYNKKKVEATFDMSGAGSNSIDCTTGIVSNIGTKGRHSANSDKFLNRITTPGYVHSYLLSSVLSSDYEDVDNNGPSLNDLGAYTKFNYATHESDFQWRVPYNATEATFNEGLKSKTNDQKGNYIYGEKELVYINTIETKTHVAVFEFSDRRDGRAARGETNTSSQEPNYQKKIDRIYLFSRPEFEPFRGNIGPNGLNGDGILQEQFNKSAIKIAHFTYDYSQCQGVPNNLGGFLSENEQDYYEEINGVEVLKNNGKLTLKEVFFTYRGSNMGRYTPYTFNYENENPNYNIKAYDVWGNYKENDALVGCHANDPITTAEFPYTDQDKPKADEYARSWSLSSIDLPSGGRLEVEMEADDYQYVQNRKVMQMFNITGAGDGNPTNEDLNKALLYNSSNDHATHLYVKVSDAPNANITIDDLIGDQIGKPIMFRALLNMTGQSYQYDYVSGYFDIQENTSISFKSITGDNEGTYVILPMKSLTLEGNGGPQVNPISKAGWYFGRTYLNKEIHDPNGGSSNDDFESIVLELVNSLSNIGTIFSGPNRVLQTKGVARKFNPEKSWVRLLNPTKRKLGGGLRITKIQLHDNWDQMTTNNLDNPLYKQFYGQEYSYENEDGSTSGVAAFEPAASKDNPFIEPIPNKEETARDRRSAPSEFNYTEMPLGESFFPSPTVTYSRVKVRNLTRVDENDPTRVVTKHATGEVVNEFFTTFDFPTITDHTDIAPTNVDIPRPLANLLNISVRSKLTFSQGFVVQTNDMNGKMKSQRVYAEGQEAVLSGVDYKYNTEGNTVNSSLPTINAKGIVNPTSNLGLHYDVVNDFRENYSKSETFGLNTNLAVIAALFLPIPVPTVFPKYALHENTLRLATTTKVIHRTGILTEKIAYDLGSQVSTKNIAWDAVTGDVLLTKTINEYDDAYYNFTYPVHWYYDGMGLASKNISLEGVLQHPVTDSPYFTMARATDLRNYFLQGDEILAYPDGRQDAERYWVSGFNTNGNGILLMDASGTIVDACGINEENFNFKIMRSGYRNQQMASMASVTSMVNPIDIDGNGMLNDLDKDSFVLNASTLINPLIVNSSAVEYKEYWRPQNESNIPGFPSQQDLDEEGNATFPEYLGVNPYLYNIKGDWRAVKSYAFLTSRKANISNVSPRKDGFYKDFLPFYRTNNLNKWVKSKPIPENKWTFASEVTKYSPYGAELENKDALDRYSSAQYGYNYTLPVAVASNSKYQEMGYNGFEDYGDIDNTNIHFWFPYQGTAVNSSGRLSQEEAHSGQYSMKVEGGKKATLRRSYESSTNSIPVVDCTTDEIVIVNCPGTLQIDQETSFSWNTGIPYEAIEIQGLGTGAAVSFTLYDVTDNLGVFTTSNQNGLLHLDFNYTGSIPIVNQPTLHYYAGYEIQLKQGYETPEGRSICAGEDFLVNLGTQ